MACETECNALKSEETEYLTDKKYPVSKLRVVDQQYCITIQFSGSFVPVGELLIASALAILLFCCQMRDVQGNSQCPPWFRRSPQASLGGAQDLCSQVCFIGGFQMVLRDRGCGRPLAPSLPTVLYLYMVLLVQMRTLCSYSA